MVFPGEHDPEPVTQQFNSVAQLSIDVSGSRCSHIPFWRSQFGSALHTIDRFGGKAILRICGQHIEMPPYRWQQCKEKQGETHCSIDELQGRLRLISDDCDFRTNPDKKREGNKQTGEP
jgi:hypothetical protein